MSLEHTPIPNLKIYFDSGSGGGGQHVLPGFESHVVSSDNSGGKGKKEKQEKQKREKNNGVTPKIRIPEHLYERPLRERKDID